ncbi:MAG: uracil-DNA glycosylase [Candidatus Acidiferrum sp.]|jgi:DNA polymerase
MSQPLPDVLREKIKHRLSFYEDLGIAPFYLQRHASGAVNSSLPTVALPVRHEEEILPKPASHAKAALTPSTASSNEASAVVGAQYAAPQLATQSAVDHRVFPAPPKTSNFFALLDRVENDSLLNIREDIGDCTRCKLHKKRTHIVFADGNPKAELVFVGEGPGADEDATGIPFVGRAGKLLTQMIEAMGLQRKDVYICNVVKCRPPENRQPDPEEVTTCSPYLVRQLEVINPKVIVCLGATAAKTLLETDMGISKFRGQWLDFRGKKLLATYHPAYLLRNPPAKSEVWKDLQKVMAELGLQVKKPKPA